MFNINNYNPFQKAWDAIVVDLPSAIASELTSPQFRNWVKCKREHDIQLVADAVVGAIAGFVQAADYCLYEGRVAATLLGTDADEVKFTGLGSAIYKAGRMAFESGALFRRQCLEGFHGINPNAKALPAIALPSAKELELTPPTPSFEPLAIAPAVMVNSPLSFKAWVMWVTRQSSLEAAVEPHTKRSLTTVLRLSGKEVKSCDRRSNLVKAIIAG